MVVIKELPSGLHLALDSCPCIASINAIEIRHLQRASLHRRGQNPRVQARRARQRLSYMLQAALGTGHPMARIPRRIVPHMLLMTTLKFRHPVKAFVQVIIHGLTRRSCGVKLLQRFHAITLLVKDTLIPRASHKSTRSLGRVTGAEVLHFTR